MSKLKSFNKNVSSNLTQETFLEENREESEKSEHQLWSSHFNRHHCD